MEGTRVVTPTSARTARVSDVVLREHATGRLIFRPMLVENENDRQAAVKGSFVYQRKSPVDEWEDHRELTLNQLRADEWIKLDLHSSELLRLYHELGALYQLFEEEGVPAGETQYYLAEAGLQALLNTEPDRLQDLLENLGNVPTDLLTHLLELTLAQPDPQWMLNILDQLRNEDLKLLSGIVGLKLLKECHEQWHNNTDNADEEFWQVLLDQYSFVVAQVFAYPVVIMQDKAYVGGKSITNTGGNIVDFLCQNEVSENVILVEIKTPTTLLLGTQYRGNAFSISRDLSGAVVQVATYRNSLISEHAHLRRNADREYHAFEPACLVVAGNYSVELDSRDKRRSFELFRAQLKNVQLVTYDELFGKVQLLIELLEGDEQKPIEEEDDIPF